MSVKQRKMCVVMDPIEDINPRKDSTLSMMLAAQDRSWKIYVCTPKDLWAEGGKAFAHTREVQLIDNDKKWFEVISIYRENELRQRNALKFRLNQIQCHGC